MTRAERPPNPAASAPASATVVIDELLHDGGVIVARGRREDGAALRVIAGRDVWGRAPAPGEVWAVTGAMRRHETYGPQHEATSAVLVRPSGRLLVDALSRSAAFPGIGAVLARRLWDALGEDTLAALDAGDPVRFEPHVGPDLARVLVDGWRALDQDVRAYRWLMRHGFPVALAAKVLAIYGRLPVPRDAEAEARAKGPTVFHLEADPYRMTAFAPWRKVDAAARRMGVPLDDERRLVGAVEAVLDEQLALSHTWIPAADLARAAARLVGAPAAVGRRAVDAAEARRAVVRVADGYQAAGCWVMEDHVAGTWRRMLAGGFVPSQRRLDWALTRDEAAARLDDYEAAEGYRLNAAQRAAVWMALTEPLSVLVGGPGVGKTTVLKAVHVLAEQTQRRVVQAALSGRAAKRMQEATGRPASTIASLIVRLDAGEVALDDEPLIVLDEASMIDLITKYRLLRRLPPGVRLLMVGDPGQLPPVGAGLVFHVAAASPHVPRTTLTEVMRQREETGIPAVCAAVREGRVPALPPPGERGGSVGERSGVHFVECAREEATDRVIDLLAALGGAGAAQVVGAVRRGPGGTLEVNARLQALTAPGRGPQLAGRFYAGDPVIATRNDYQIPAMNGEIGVVEATTESGGLRVAFDPDTRDLPAAYVDHLDLAHAVTCHKAQGSQWPLVIVPVFPSRILDRTLILTAISRAQEQVVLVGDRAAFEAAVRAPAEPSRRRVGLALRDLSPAAAPSPTRIPA